METEVPLAFVDTSVDFWSRCLRTVRLSSEGKDVRELTRIDPVHRQVYPTAVHHWQRFDALTTGGVGCACARATAGWQDPRLPRSVTALAIAVG
jgi:hypothetical protein